METLQFLEVNQVAVEHYGYSRNEFLTMTIADIRPPEDVRALHDLLRAKQPGFQRSGQWRHRRKAGDIIDVQVVSHELEFGGQRARLVVAHDVTERNRAQAQLQRAMTELEQRNERLSALYHISQLINSSLHVDAILEHLADEAMRVTRATHGQILIVSAVERRFERHALRGFSPEEELLAQQTPLLLDRGINSRVYRTGQNIRVDDVQAEPDYFGLIPATRSELAIPVLREGRVIGNFDLQSPEPAASPRRIRRTSQRWRSRRRWRSRTRVCMRSWRPTAPCCSRLWPSAQRT
jgi:PAS domain S-box-containing protein